MQLFLSIFAVLSAAAQTLSDAQFQIAYGASGITSGAACRRPIKSSGRMPYGIDNWKNRESSFDATVVTDDPLFGLFAYGGDLSRRNRTLEVIPKDGLRARLHVLLDGKKVSLVFDHDGFAKGRPIRMDGALSSFAFTVENRSGDAHSMWLEITGGAYKVLVAGRQLQTIPTESGIRVEIPISAAGTEVTVTR